MDTVAPLPRPMLIEEFAPLVGDDFTVDCAPRAARLTLVDAVALPAAAMALRPAFSLRFSSDADTLLVAGSYVMRSGAFGPDRIYIAPVLSPPGSDRQHYEAIFN